MDIRAPTVPKTTRLSAWAADELRPDQLAKSTSAALLNFFLNTIIIISFTALVFSGDLAGQLPSVIPLIGMGDVMLVLITAALSSYPGTLSVTQDAPAALLALASASVLRIMPAGSSLAEKLYTIVAVIAVTTLLTGLFLIVLGHFRLGGLARFLPYPVMGGFLAGTGWLLVTGGLGTMTGAGLGLALLGPGELALWLPGVVFGAVLLLATSRSNSPLVFPGLFGGPSPCSTPVPGSLMPRRLSSPPRAG